MSRIVVSQFVTVDGVVEDPGGAESFEHGGWAFQFERGPDGDKFKLDEVMGSDALLLGRVTYEGFAAAWPSREGEFADKFNTMPKYVVSSTLDNPEWNNSTVIGLDDLSGAARPARRGHPRQRLGASSCRRSWRAGSSTSTGSWSSRSSSAAGRSCSPTTVFASRSACWSRGRPARS